MDGSFVEDAVKNYGDTVLRAAFSVTGNRTDAEDVFSDVFFALYKRGEKFNGETHLKAWLIRSAVNRAKNIKSSYWSKNRTQLSDYIAAPEYNFDSSVMDAMQKLKDDERAVLYLHYYEGFAFKEIANILKMREGSVRSRASRARAALKELLSD